MTDPRRRWAPALLMLMSGFAGLGYQIVWTEQCAHWQGHESAAVLAVVAAFFGGLGVGAWALGARIEKSARPVRWYAGCELMIALWSLLLTSFMPIFSAWALGLTGVAPTPLWQWTVAFCGTFALLLPATAAMGATLPAMQRIEARLAGVGQSIAALYAANTFGAVLGVLGVAFWLLPRVGLNRSAEVCMALNLLCGVAALGVFPSSADATSSAPAKASAPASARANANQTLFRLAATGLLGIGYEVLVVRVLGQVTEDTVYTFALLLAVYLVGSAVGAACYQRWLLPRPKRERLTDLLLGSLAAACLLGTASLWAAELVKAAALGALGGSWFAALAVETVPALLAFGPATLVMGALFSHLARAANAAGIGFGRALGVNTLAAAAAPALFGVMIAPALGPKWALLLVDAGYLALVTRRAWSRAVVWLPAAGVALLALLAPPLAFVDVPDGGHLVSYQDGVMAAVSVVQDADGVLRLRINNRAQEGSSATQRVDGRQAWLPLLLHPAPHHALFLGLGTGVTAASAAEDPTLHVDAVELLPEVITASRHFASSVAGGAAYPRLRLLAADARRYVRASDRRYDVIVADNYHPARSGSGSLYTVEHFNSVRARLDSGGLFCQWLPLHQLDRETLQSIVSAFLAVYPQGSALIASNSLETPVLGLIGRRDAERFDVARVRERLERLALPERVARLGLEDAFAVLGSFVAGPASLRRFAANAVANTDDLPIVAFRAPRITYAPDSSPRDRFIALLRELSVEPSQLISGAPDPAWPGRLAAYWSARDRFIESGRDVHPSARVEDMLAQVQSPLLSVLQLSPDFRPAYDPLLAMATALARSNVSGARALLSELTQLQPARNDAAQVLAQIDAPR
jgi:spermidine synthase